MLVPPLCIVHSPPPPSPPADLSPPVTPYQVNSPETVDYDPVPMCSPGWLHMGGGWYGV
jgi:hypothetical protein